MSVWTTKATEFLHVCDEKVELLHAGGEGIFEVENRFALSTTQPLSGLEGIARRIKLSSSPGGAPAGVVFGRGTVPTLVLAGRLVAWAGFPESLPNSAGRLASAMGRSLATKYEEHLHTLDLRIVWRCTTVCRSSAKMRDPELRNASKT